MAALLAHPAGGSVSAGFFGAPTSARALLSLRTSTGALAVLGLLHAEAEWTPRLALYAVGRAGAARFAPHAAWAPALPASVAVTSGAHPGRGAARLREPCGAARDRPAGSSQQLLRARPRW
ncbi:MAG: hypothetical protein U0325_34030 [Polyangiales bacterium]